MEDDANLKPIECKFIRDEYHWDRMGDVNWDMLRNNLDAVDRVLSNPDKFPKADFAYLEKKATEIEMFLLLNSSLSARSAAERP